MNNFNLVDAPYHPQMFEQNRSKEAEILEKIDEGLFIGITEKIDAKDFENASKQGKMFKETFRAKKNCVAFEGIQERTVINKLFFSPKNVENVQKMIRYTVHKHSGFTIGNQSEAELLIIMRSMFLQYSKNPLITDINAQKDVIRNEINRINNLVINDTVPRIVSEAQQYIHYLRDIDEPLKPQARSENTNIKGTKSFRDISEIFQI